MGELRIIAGTLRGRKIRVPPGLTVRPTSDRVRESLFDILGPLPPGARVLDVYAGSGALGLEALSRGAVAATFLESDREVLKILRANAASLGVDARCRILEGDATARLLTARGIGEPFDLALADPPYGLGRPEELLGALSRGGVLAPGARVVFERDRRSEPTLGPDARLPLERTARYGRTCLDFYRWQPGPGPAV